MPAGDEMPCPVIQFLVIDMGTADVAEFRSPAVVVEDPCAQFTDPVHLVRVIVTVPRYPER